MREAAGIAARGIWAHGLRGFPMVLAGNETERSVVIVLAAIDGLIVEKRVVFFTNPCASIDLLQDDRHDYRALRSELLWCQTRLRLLFQSESDPILFTEA